MASNASRKLFVAKKHKRLIQREAKLHNYKVHTITPRQSLHGSSNDRTTIQERAAVVRQWLINVGLQNDDDKTCGIERTLCDSLYLALEATCIICFVGGSAEEFRWPCCGGVGAGYFETYFLHTATAMKYRATKPGYTDGPLPIFVLFMKKHEWCQVHVSSENHDGDKSRTVHAATDNGAYLKKVHGFGGVDKSKVLVYIDDDVGSYTSTFYGLPMHPLD
jgi:hypothetical protein